MASPRMVRWGGIGAVLGGAATAAGAFAPQLGPGNSSLSTGDYLAAVLPGVAWLLLLGGLIGLHARQAGAYGRLGTAGFLLAFLGNLLAVVLWPFVVSALMSSGGGAPDSPVGVIFAVAGLVDIIGLALLGIATLRAGVLALPWRALPLGIVLLGVLSSFSLPLYFALGGRNPAESVVLGLPEVLIGLSWVLLGYALWSSGTGVARRRSAPAG